MEARRAVKSARGDLEGVTAARVQVDDAKRALGERGLVWWSTAPPTLIVFWLETHHMPIGGYRTRNSGEQVGTSTRSRPHELKTETDVQ